MTAGYAVLLGLVQGLTEFLPVSSSGHLVIMQSFFGVESPGISVEVAAHVGTLLAVLTAYGLDVIHLVLGFFSGLSREGRRRPEFRGALFILAGSVPAGLVGVLWKDSIEVLFDSPAFAAVGLLLTGIVLFISGGNMGRPFGAGLRLDEVGTAGALFVGAAQALAIAPGVSRSGMTISAGIAGGLRPEEAARYSFLLSLPATAGAALLGIRDLSGTHQAAGLEATLVIVALVSFVSGTIALRYVIGRIRRGGLRPFAYYCWAVGIISLLLALRTW